MPFYKVKVTKIDYDDEADSENLPQELEFDDIECEEEDLFNEICVGIENETGWLVKNFQYTILSQVDLHPLPAFIRGSWTYDRLTDDEKNRLIEAFNSVPVRSALKYTDKHKNEVINAVYTTFLLGVGYDGPAWRD